MELSNKKSLAWMAATALCIYATAQKTDTDLHFYAGWGLLALGVQLGITINNQARETEVRQHLYAEAARLTELQRQQRGDN